MLVLTFLMILVNRINNMSVPLLVTAFSLIMVIFFCSQNNLVSATSVNVVETYDQWGRYFFIQDDSKNTEDDSKNTQDNPKSKLDTPSSVFDKKSESTNQSSSGSSDELVTSESLSNDTVQDNLNQTTSELPESQSEENANQSVESQNQVQDNLNQTTSELPGPQSEENVTKGIESQNQVQNNQEINVNTTQKNKVETEQRLELIISEEEGEKPIPLEEQRKIESQDEIVMKQHKSLSGPNCRTGNVLSGASNEGDLKVLSECQEAIGIAKHTKKMDDGDYKFFLDVDKKYDFLVNDKNNQKTDGFLVVEIVPKDQDITDISLPKTGDQVHVWGAWVTDKPKGWHEIHPAWKVGNE